MPRFLSVAQADAAVPRPIHAVLTAAGRKRLVVTALPGVRPDGTLPDGLDAQAGQAFANLAALLGTAGLKADDLVGVVAVVSAPGAAAPIQAAAARALGPIRPSIAVRQVVALTREGSMVELDAEAVAET